MTVLQKEWICGICQLLCTRRNGSTLKKDCFEKTKFKWYLTESECVRGKKKILDLFD